MPIVIRRPRVSPQASRLSASSCLSADISSSVSSNPIKAVSGSANRAKRNSSSRIALPMIASNACRDTVICTPWPRIQKSAPMIAQIEACCNELLHTSGKLASLAGLVGDPQRTLRDRMTWRLDDQFAILGLRPARSVITIACLSIVISPWFWYACRTLLIISRLAQAQLASSAWVRCRSIPRLPCSTP